MEGEGCERQKQCVVAAATQAQQQQQQPGVGRRQQQLLPKLGFHAAGPISCESSVSICSKATVTAGAP
jgi:hypothetical protein